MLGNPSILLCVNYLSYNHRNIITHPDLPMPLINCSSCGSVTLIYSCQNTHLIKLVGNFQSLWKDVFLIADGYIIHNAITT